MTKDTHLQMWKVFLIWCEKISVEKTLPIDVSFHLKNSFDKSSADKNPIQKVLTYKKAHGHVE